MADIKTVEPFQLWRGEKEQKRKEKYLHKLSKNMERYETVLQGRQVNHGKLLKKAPVTMPSKNYSLAENPGKNLS